MSERTVPSVECELCSEPFDPTEAGGWCTNSDCGEWQYETYADYDPEASSAADGASAADADASAGNDGGESSSSNGQAGAGNVDATGSLEDAVPPSEEAASEGNASTESVSADTDDAATEEAVETEPANSQTDVGVELGECPECGAVAKSDHRFCTGCGTDLDEIREAIADVTSCPDCGEDVSATDRYCRACGADLAGIDESEGGDDTADEPAELALEAYGRSIVVIPGDTVGREVRSLLTDAGRPDDEAVRVHREHVRFVREDGEFYVVDLGENPTAVNGSKLEKGDRVAVERGDDLTLSEVVTLSIGENNA